MVQALSLIVAVWVCLAVIFPLSINAQPESNEAETNTPVKTKTGPEQKMTLSSEPEASDGLGGEVRETAPRITRIRENFQLSPTETVDGITLIGGDAEIAGEVLGNILVLRGNVDIKEGAKVLGRVTVVLGRLKGKDYLEADGLKIPGLYKEIHGLKLVPAMASLIMRPQEVWGVKKETKFVWGTLTFVMLTLIHVGLVGLFKRQMDNMALIISHRPVGSTLLGILILICVPYLTTFLLLSIIGIPLMLVFLSGLLPLAIYGKTAIFLSMGRAILPQRADGTAVIIGYWIYRMATAIPHMHIDWLTFVVASTIGIGVSVRTLLGRKSAPVSRSPQHWRYSSPR